jgi:hypothetical protein
MNRIRLIDVPECPRCTQFHKKQTFMPMRGEPDFYWTLCPVNVEPIIIRQTPNAQRPTSNAQSSDLFPTSKRPQ